MVKLRNKKQLIFPLIIVLAVTVLILMNAKEFVIDGVTDWRSIFKCLGLYALMCGVLAFKIELPNLISSIASVVLLAVSPLMIFETVRVIVSAPKYDPYIYELNLLFYAAILFAAFALTQSPRISVLCAMIISWAAHAANELVLLIRGTPLVPTDLFALETAMTVTSPEDWHFNSAMLIGTVAAVVICAFCWQFKLTYPKKFKWLRIPAALIGLGVAIGMCVNISWIDHEDFSTSTFDQESTNNLNGVALSFYINVKKMNFDEPVGYDEQALEEYIAQYVDEILPEGKELPNIIVIMNESFSDLSYLGKLRTDTKYMPYFNSLKRNYPSGKLLVSVLGGGTCNTEFEFLTSLSMLNMPNGCYTYMQHITGEIPSLASYLKGYGYQTVAMHPFYEICWKRNSVYKFMGFDDYISGEDMSSEHGLYESADRWNKGFGDDVEYVRTLISDSFFYKQVIEQFENKTEDRIFIFGVTVQNHSSYEYEGEDFVTDVHITKPEGEYPRAEQYLSLVKKSDEALEELITYFEGVEEETLIVFFGDHQPNVEAELINELAPYRNLIVNSYLTRFQTPFVIWANYDIGGRKDLGIISSNYLGIETLKYAGVPLSAEYQMIDGLRETAASMAAWGYYDRFNCWYDREEEYEDVGLNMYKYYTYRMLGDG